MSDVKDAVKLEPGEWIVSEHRSPAFAPGAVVDVVAAGPGDPCPWVARNKGACPSNFVWFHDNGVSLSGQTRLARKVNCESARIASLEAENAALEARLESACKKVVRLEAAQSAEQWGDNAKLHNRITELEGQIATYRDKAMWKLIVAGYAKAPFTTEPRYIIDSAKAMLRAVEGGA